MTNEKLKTSCPGCNWEPDGYPHWQCNCGHIWNTFETTGVCPDCNKRWTFTQCPKCEKTYDHEDWYLIPIDFEKLLNYGSEQNQKRKNNTDSF